MRFLSRAIVTLATAGVAPFLTAAAILPAGAQFRVAATTDRPDYVLGQNVLITFTLENTGAEEFTASFGGDYRGGTRANRFKVTATDARGVKVNDPNPDQQNFGGFGRDVKLDSGKTFSEKISLARYCRITRPGTYDVRVWHDCGWSLPVDRTPSGEVTITFRSPTTDEARSIVAQIVEGNGKTKMPDGWRSGAEILNLREWSDLASLQAPVYLPALKDLARTGMVEALPGIGGIATPEATAVLLDLAATSEGKMSLAAAAELRKRMPELVLPNQPPTAQARLAALAWDESLRPGTLSLARKWLARPEPDFIQGAAAILRLVGAPEDAPALFEALSRTIAPLTVPRDTDPAGNYPEPAQSLLGALFGLRTRGYTFPPVIGESAGATLSYLDSFRAKQTLRPDGWLQVFKSGCASPLPVLREAAIRSVPYPVPPECAALVTAAKNDPDAGVQAAVLFAMERKVIIRPPPGYPKNLPQQVQIMTIPAEPLPARESPK